MLAEMTAFDSPGPAPAPADARVVLLVLEPDPLLREMLAAGLRLWSDRFEVLPVEDAAAATRALERTHVDLVLAEIAPAGATARDLLALLRERAPGAPVLLLTEAPAEVFRRGLDYDGLIAKPPDIDELAGRIEALLARGRRSVVRGIALASFLQVLAADAKSGSLEVRARGQSGTLGLLDGQVVHAETSGVNGREALYRMLRWNDPVLTLLPALPERQTLDDALPALLLEFSVLEDRGRLGR